MDGWMDGQARVSDESGLAKTNMSPSLGAAPSTADSLYPTTHARARASPDGSAGGKDDDDEDDDEDDDDGDEPIGEARAREANGESEQGWGEDARCSCRWWER